MGRHKKNTEVNNVMTLTAETVAGGAQTVEAETKSNPLIGTENFQTGEVTGTPPESAPETTAEPATTEKEDPSVDKSPGLILSNERQSRVLGLLPNVKYFIGEDSSINWRAMVPTQYLYINPLHEKIVTRKYAKPLAEIDIINDKVEDKHLVIILAGLKYLAKMRGYKSVTYRPIVSAPDYCSTVCSIEFIGNFETDYEPVRYEALAGASLLNTKGFGQNYLPEMAENRAFNRAVRSFLNINIVSKEELSEDQPLVQDVSDDEKNSYQLLQDMLEKHNYTFESLKEKMVQKGKTEFNGFQSLQDIPKLTVFELLTVLKRKT